MWDLCDLCDSCHTLWSHQQKQPVFRPCPDIEAAAPGGAGMNTRWAPTASPQLHCLRKEAGFYEWDEITERRRGWERPGAAKSVSHYSRSNNTQVIFVRNWGWSPSLFCSTQLILPATVNNNCFMCNLWNLQYNLKSHSLFACNHLIIYIYQCFITQIHAGATWAKV